jgi:hypothetical protein
MLTKISNVKLYFGLTDTGLPDCYACRDILDQEQISYDIIHYTDAAQYSFVFSAINSWGLGEVTDFPFVTWDEEYDDRPGEGFCNMAIGSTALQSSTLVQNKGLIL